MKFFSQGLLARILSVLLVCCMVSVLFGSVANARYISPDNWDPTMPGVGTNRYAYANNDPINKSDPSGHCFEDACLVEGAIAARVAYAIWGAIFGTTLGVAVVNSPLVDTKDPAVSENRKSEEKYGAFGEEYTPSGKITGDVPNPSGSDLAGLTHHELDKQIDKANTSIEVRGEEQVFGSKDPDTVSGHDERIDREQSYLDKLEAERDRRDAEREKAQKNSDNDSDNNSGKNQNSGGNKSDQSSGNDSLNRDTDG